MGNGITLRNPVVNSVPPAIAIGKKGVDENGRSLSTGLKANIDVVSSFLGNGLADKAKVLSKVLESMGYSANVLRVTQDSLASMATTLSDMLALSSQNGGSETAIRSLNDILQQKIEQLKTQIKTSDYDGRKLLGGDLGSDSSVRTKFISRPVSVASYTAVTGVVNGDFAASNTAVIGKTAITLATNNIATGLAGDKITIGTSSFTFVGSAPDYSKNEILKGGTDVETAKNIVTAIRNSPDENLRYYDVDLFNKSVVISQRSAGSSIPLNTAVVSAGAALAATAPSSQIITFGAVGVAGNTVTVGGQVFTMRANGAPAYAADEVDVGVNATGSATNLVAKINAHPVTKGLVDRGLITVSNLAGVVTIESAGGAALTNVISSNVVNAPVTAGLAPLYTAATGGIDVSGIKNIDGFIGSPTPTVTVTNHAISAGGNGAADALYKQLNGGIASVVPAPSGNGDVTVALTATIAGKSFQALVFFRAGGNLNNAVIEFKGEAGTFKVKGNATFNPVITTRDNARDNLAESIKRVLTSAVFVQDRDLTINTDAGDVVVDGGAAVASVEGMTVSLKSDKFADRKFEDFSIERSTDGVAGSVKLTAVISGTSFVADNLRPIDLVKGLALKLKPDGGGKDVLTINLGERGLSSLNETANYQPIAKAIKAALTSSGSGIDVRVGLGFDDSLKVQIPDVSISKIFRDRFGVFVEKLSVLTPVDARVAQEVLTNALNSVSSALSKVKGQSETIDAASTSLSSSIAVTKDAAASYLDTDLVEAASAFSAALKSILAAISTLQAGARVADAGLEIIKSAAQ
jgi:flagellin-like hook-associated protein FlgL